MSEQPSEPPDSKSSFRAFLTELRRRKVVRVAAGYAVVVFAVLEGADLVLPTLGVPEWVFQLLVVLTLLGFPVALILAWAFDLTPEGVQPDAAGRHGPKTPLAYQVGGVVASLLIVAGGAYWYLAVRPSSAGAPIDTVVAESQVGAAPDGSAIPLRSIAVLPFVALGSEEDLTYLGDGIAGEILRGLGRAPDLLVAARSSSFKLRGEDARTVRDRLGVAYVLEGSIQRSGDQVRVTVAMISTLDESTLWSDQFQGDFTDVFAIQDSIAHGVFERLRLEFTSGGARVVHLSTDDPRAFTEYLRGRSAANQRTPAGLQEGISHYTNAIELDPGFAEAYAALAIAHTFQGVVLSATSETAYAAALVAAEEALELDPSNAEAHAALATVRSHWQWDFSGAEEEFQRALALQPQYAAARQWYSQLLQVMGRSDEAIAQAEEALRTDDLSITSHVALSVSYYMAGRYTDALDRLDSALDRFPESPGIHEVRGWTLRELGRFEEAVEAHRTAVSGGQGLLAEGSLAIALSSAGRLDEARTLVRHLETEDRRFPVLAVRLALVYAHLDEIDTAFDHLESAYERRDPWLTFARVDPAFAPLRDDPRFRDLIERVGLPPGGGGGDGGGGGGGAGAGERGGDGGSERGL